MSLDYRVKRDLSIDGVKFATLWLVVLGHVLRSTWSLLLCPGQVPWPAPFIAFICRSFLCWQVWFIVQERAAVLSFGKKSSGSYYRVWQSSSVL